MRDIDGESASRGAPGVAAADRLAGLESPEFTPASVCEEAGVDRDVADRLWRAMGFPDVPEDECAFTRDDAQALAWATEGLAAVEDDERAIEILTTQARMLSGHLAAVAEIQLESTEAALAVGLQRELVTEAAEIGLEHSRLGWLLLYLVRRQLRAAAIRRAKHADQPTHQLAIAFVDLVGFTELAAQLDPARLGRLLNRFEKTVYDAVAESGGRVVKLIGDEAMFTCPDVPAAVAATDEIISKCGSNDMPEARGGLAHGAVLGHGGDVFGTPVNLAARLTAHAPARGLLVSEAAAKAVDGAESIQINGLRGFGTVKAVLVRM